MGGILKPTIELPCGTVINVPEHPTFRVGDVFVVPPWASTPESEAFHAALDSHIANMRRADEIATRKEVDPMKKAKPAPKPMPMKKGKGC